MTTDSPAFTLITGASSTIGGAIAVRASKERRLILSGRDEARLAEVRGACARPDDHRVWPFDLADAENVAQALEAWLRAEGVVVESFIHCAGVTAISAVRTVSYARVKKTFDVNFTSAALISGTLMKKLVNREALRNIVFISSIFSRMGVKAQTLYCASKAALDGLMRALAVELAPAVRVNSILPGAIPSRMSSASQADENIVKLLEKNYPLGLGTPEAVASAVAFLLSPDAAWITGQEFVVDGGRAISHPFE